MYSRAHERFLNGCYSVLITPCTPTIVPRHVVDPNETVVRKPSSRSARLRHWTSFSSWIQSPHCKELGITEESSWKGTCKGFRKEWNLNHEERSVIFIGVFLCHWTNTSGIFRFFGGRFSGLHRRRISTKWYKCFPNKKCPLYVLFFYINLQVHLYSLCFLKLRSFATYLPSPNSQRKLRTISNLQG